MKCILVSEALERWGMTDEVGSGWSYVWRSSMLDGALIWRRRRSRMNLAEIPAQSCKNKRTPNRVRPIMLCVVAGSAGKVW